MSNSTHFNAVFGPITVVCEVEYDVEGEPDEDMVERLTVLEERREVVLFNEKMAVYFDMTVDGVKPLAEAWEDKIWAVCRREILEKCATDFEDRKRFKE